MKEDPLFNIYMYAMYEDEIFDIDRREDYIYAHNIVEGALSAGNLQLAGKAAVVLNVWMMIIHQLYTSVRTCKEGSTSTKYIDTAVALWIGKGQSEGSFIDGYLLHSLTQQAAKRFGNAEGEASINSQMISAFVQFQNQTLNCENDPNAYLDLRVQVKEMIRLMSVPLVQNIFFAVSINDTMEMKLYAEAVVPQLAGCDSASHARLKEMLITNSEGGGEEMNMLLSHLMDCLQISCDDLNLNDGAAAEIKKVLADVCESFEAKNSVLNFVQDYDSENLETSPQSKHDALSRIDLDIHQIDIFMRTKAYDAAFDYYVNGMNALRTFDSGVAVPPTALISLQELATLQSRTPVSSLDLFTESFGTSSFADDLATNAIMNTGDFNAANRQQRADAALAVNLGLVSFLAIQWSMSQAVLACKEGSTDSSINFWNAAIAMYVGSADSQQKSWEQGFSLYGLANSQCPQFGSCSESREALSGGSLLSSYDVVRKHLVEQTCADAELMLEQEILPLLQAPLIQATISGALFEESSQTPSKDGYSSGYVYSKAILPIVENASSESASLISDIFQSPIGSITSEKGTEQIIDAFQSAIPDMMVQCNLLGKIQNTALCHEYELPVQVLVYTKLGLDVKEMYEALNNGQIESARGIYEDGKNAAPITPDGKALSLQNLSTTETLSMRNKPLFNLFVYTASKRLPNDSSESFNTYADVFVQETLASQSESSKALAAEAAVALNVWMHTTHLAYEAFVQCAAGRATDDILEFIDIAAAHWIGDAVIGSDTEVGHLLYALANEMSQHFEISSGNVVGVNNQMLALFAEAKHQAMDCQNKSSTAAELHNTVTTMTQQMTIPLVQALLHALIMEDEERVKLYSYAILPMLATCNSNDYKFFLDTFSAEGYDTRMTQTISDRVYSILPCLRLTCDDVGSHFMETSQSISCAPSANTTATSGYRPAYQQAFDAVSKFPKG